MKPKAIVCIPMFVAVIFSACGNKIEPGNTARGEGQTIIAAVAVAHISQEPFLYEAVASINAFTTSTISAKLMGTVQAVHVHEGDPVKKGDLLVTIDPRTVTAQLEQAQAGFREARQAQASAMSSRDAAASAADLAESTYRRYLQLQKENSVSRQEFDEVESRFHQAKAALSQTEAMAEAAHSRVQQAQSALDQAMLAQKDARILSPYKGRVVAKMVETGTLAAPGTPLLVVEEEGHFNAELVLPERHIQAVKVGMEVTVRVPSLNNLATKGEICQIIPAADARSRSFEVKVCMPEDLDLKSGMFARVFVPLGGTGILLVPQTAIVEQGQLTGIFIVDENRIARFRLVRLGKTLADRVEIISRVKEGQRYVSEVPVTLKDGMKVEDGE